MEGWITLWKVALYSGVGLFFLMSLWVIVGGYRDIQRMFADLRAQRDSQRDIQPGDDVT